MWEKNTSSSSRSSLDCKVAGAIDLYAEGEKSPEEGSGFTRRIVRNNEDAAAAAVAQVRLDVWIWTQKDTARIV